MRGLLALVGIFIISVLHTPPSVLGIDNGGSGGKAGAYYFLAFPVIWASEVWGKWLDTGLAVALIVAALAWPRKRVLGHREKTE